MTKIQHIKVIQKLTGHRAAVFALEQTSNSKEFLSAAGDGLVVKWDMQHKNSGQVVAKIEGNIFSLLKTESRLVIGNMYGGIHWIDAKDHSNIRNILHHEKGVFGLCQIEEYVYSIGGQGKITKWNPNTCQAIESLNLSNQSLRTIDYDARRKLLAVGSSDNNIYLLNPKLEVLHSIPNAHDNSVFSVAFSPDGKHLWSGGRDAQLKIWNLDTLACAKQIPAHLYTINQIAFHPKKALVFTASRDRSIKVWNRENGHLLKVIDATKNLKNPQGHYASVNNLLWHDTANCLISCSDDRDILVWEFE